SYANVVRSKMNTPYFGGLFRHLLHDALANQFVYAPVLTAALHVFRGAAHQAGAYVQQSFGFASGRGHLRAGVRQDEYSVTSAEITSPYAGVSFEPWTKTRLELDWGQYGQFPELNQFFSIFARGSLLPE